MIRPWIDRSDRPRSGVRERLRGLDSPRPVELKSILVYDQGRASLRCPVAQQLDLDNVGLAALRIISPPPYLLRVLVPYSRAAAEVAAALVARKVSAGVPAAAEANLDTIMQTAGDDLRSRGIPLVAVMLPIASLLDAPPEMQRFGTRMMESARKGVPSGR
jgi:hypothetical protein